MTTKTVFTNSTFTVNKGSTTLKKASPDKCWVKPLLSYNITLYIKQTTKSSFLIDVF